MRDFQNAIFNLPIHKAQCKVGSPSCDPGEVCQPDPDTSTGNGVCLEDSKDPIAINQLDAILTGKSSGGPGIPEGQCMCEL